MSWIVVVGQGSLEVAASVFAEEMAPVGTLVAQMEHRIALVAAPIVVLVSTEGIQPPAVADRMVIALIAKTADQVLIGPSLAVSVVRTAT